MFESDVDIPYTRVNRFSQKSSPHIKISRRQTSDVKQVPCSDDTVRSSVARANWRFGFVHFWDP